jgi:threonine dehydratase
MHPFDQPEVIAGGGTLGLEIEEQVPDVDTVLMGVGGGGPLAGIAAWCGDRVRVIGVEPEGCASMTAALAAGEPVVVPVGGAGSDSLGAARVGDHVFPIVRDRVDRMALVTEDQIREAQRALWSDVRLIVEPGGAAAFAALRSGAFDVSPGERICVVLSGGNCDPSTITA